MYQDLNKLTKASKVVVFSGAGMSAESGISTFRNNGGLWEQYKIEEVATPEAWRNDKEKVLHFYNLRRKQLLEVEPNKAHELIAHLEDCFSVSVITQNVDNLHERAGSNKVLHLHGELMKAESTLDKSLVYTIKGWELSLGMKCEKGSQLRPHVVWFGEEVPMMEAAQEIVKEAEFIIIIGTSLNVYPAAGLVAWAPANTPKLVIDPAEMNLTGIQNIHHLKLKATEGMREVNKLVRK